MTTTFEYWHINATFVSRDRVEEISSPYNVSEARQTRTTIWQVEQELGRGTFGEVRLERQIASGRQRAVKRITLDHNDYEKELLALVEFSRPRYRNAAAFVEFLGWFNWGPHIYFAMEYLPLGDLDSVIKAQSSTLSLSESKEITKQILTALDIMHGENFTHRDLKPKNVLVVTTSPWHIKLADFGLSKRLTDSMAFNTKCGSPVFQAPELRFDYLEEDDDGIRMTNAVDIWATGCITYNIITGTLPFPSNSSTLKSYCKGSSKLPNHKLLDSKATRFLRLLLAPRSQYRPSTTEILKHEWLASTQPEQLGRPTEKRDSDRDSPEKGSDGLCESDNDYNTISHPGLKSLASDGDNLSHTHTKGTATYRHSLHILSPNSNSSKKNTKSTESAQSRSPPRNKSHGTHTIAINTEQQSTVKPQSSHQRGESTKHCAPFVQDEDEATLRPVARQRGRSPSPMLEPTEPLFSGSSSSLPLRGHAVSAAKSPTEQPHEDPLVFPLRKREGRQYVCQTPRAPVVEEEPEDHYRTYSPKHEEARNYSINNCRLGPDHSNSAPLPTRSDKASGSVPYYFDPNWIAEPRVYADGRLRYRNPNSRPYSATHRSPPPPSYSNIWSFEEDPSIPNEIASSPPRRKGEGGNYHESYSPYFADSPPPKERESRRRPEYDESPSQSFQSLRRKLQGRTGPEYDEEPSSRFQYLRRERRRQVDRYYRECDREDQQPQYRPRDRSPSRPRSRALRWAPEYRGDTYEHRRPARNSRPYHLIPI